jgi:Flp pilus assembly protein TadG
MVKTCVKTLLRKLTRREDGQALVEFALIVPIFLLLVFAVIEFGQAWNVYQSINSAAGIGARTAVLANPTVTLDTVAARINVNLHAAGIDTAAAIKTVAGFKGTSGSPATVTISYPYQLHWLQPFMGWTTAQAAFNMNSSVTMRNE